MHQRILLIKEATINRDQAQGSWTKLMGKAKRIWGDLTDDDFKKVEGSAERLFGMIQSRFGDTKEAIEKKMSSLH